MATTSAQPSVAVQAAGAASLTIKPIQAALGAEIICGDVRALDARQSQLIKQAWLDHLVLLFRGQSLNDDELVAFAQRFGKLSHPVAGHQLHGNVETFRHPHVNVVSNVVENGVPIGALPDGEMWFHHDMSYSTAPNRASFLYSIQIPSTGGDTMFASMYAAYDNLPQRLKDRIEGRMVLQAFDEIQDARIDLKSVPLKDLKHCWQPIVIRHPETGRKALYVSPRFTIGIEGMADDEADEILDFLFEHQIRPEFVYRHKWRDGDLVMWDNRSVIHQATGGFTYPDIRTMHRTVVAGDRPY